MRDKLIHFRGSRSQSEMAEKYNVTQQTWSQWERGDTSPRAIIMKKLEIDSGIPMEELFFDLFNKYNLLNNQQTTILQKTG